MNINKEQLHASTTALNGYCAFHRLLLMFVEEYPQIKEQANKTVSNFIRDESFRFKSVVSNLGQFLPLLTFSDITWQRVAHVRNTVTCAHLLNQTDADMDRVLCRW